MAKRVKKAVAKKAVSKKSSPRMNRIPEADLKPVQTRDGAPQRTVRSETGISYAISRDYPIPSSTRGLGKHANYPFKELEIGESFEVKVAQSDAKQKRSHLVAAAAHYKKHYNTASKFTVRQVDKTSVRVWRVK